MYSVRGIPSVLWGITAVHVGGGKQQYMWGEETAVHVGGRETAVHLGDNSSTCGGIALVLWRLFSTVGDSFSTVEGIQYIGGITSVHAGWITSVQWGITSVLWRVFSTVGEEF